MNEFEVKVQQNPNAKVKAWTIKAKDEKAARAHAEHMLILAGAKSGKVLGVRKLPK